MIFAAIDLEYPEHHGIILRNAHEFAVSQGKRLAVISVLPDFGMSLLSPWFKDGATENVLREAGEALHRAVTEALGEEVDQASLHILRQGTIYQEILTAADKHEPTLIVMGAHRPDLRDYLIGPNAARVVRHAKCSVLVLRD